MSRINDIILTAIAPAIWGTTYLVTTQYLPAGYPVTLSLLRALPAGLLLLLFVRTVPKGWWWLRVFILGALNFTVFWILLFISAYRLPGGVAATVGALQPLIVIFLARMFLGSPIRNLSLLASILGVAGVALLLLNAQAVFDPIGVAAGVGAAISMAVGTVLSRLWRPQASLLTFTAWQLTAGGLLLAPLAFWLEPALPSLTAENFFGFFYLCLAGAAFSYFLWFRGIERMQPSAVSIFGFLSPVVAILLGWWFLDQRMGALQIVGFLIVLMSIWLGQWGANSDMQLSWSGSKTFKPYKEV